MRFIANERGRLLTLGRIFITERLKSSPTSCLYGTQLDYGTVPCFHKNGRRNINAYVNIYCNTVVLDAYVDHKF